MSTWHQQNANSRAYKAGKPTVFWHETLWTVVVDPPNEMTCLMRFDAEQAARKYQKNAAHSYVLPPYTNTKK